MTDNENKNRRDLIDKIIAKYDRKIDRACALAETAARRLSQGVAAEAKYMTTAEFEALGRHAQINGLYVHENRAFAGTLVIDDSVDYLARYMAAVFDGLRRYGSIDALTREQRHYFKFALAALNTFWKWDPLRISFDRALGAFFDAVDLLENREKRILEQVDAQERAEKSEELIWEQVDAQERAEKSEELYYIW